MNKIPFTNNNYNKENIEKIEYYFDRNPLEIRDEFLNSNAILSSMKYNIEYINSKQDIIDSISKGTKESVVEIFNLIEVA